MSLRRRPQSVDEFINGGSLPGAASTPEPTQTEAEENEPETIAITLRIPSDLLAELDAKAKKRRPRCSRNTWILEAIVEKLEQGKQSN